MRRASLESYRKGHPLPRSRLASGLLAEGERREVTTDEMEHPVVVEAFTIPEAAAALGRSELCLKRWIADGVIPPPILRDTVRSYRQYSVGELRVIAEALRLHEREFKYLSTSHTFTITRIWQSMQGYRATRV